MSNWSTPIACDDALMQLLGELFTARETFCPGSFPDLRSDGHLVMAADYSGEHKESAYQVLTFLLADRPGILNNWDFDRMAIRHQFLKDTRTHAFKSLGDGNRQKALVPFLRASSRINGILFIVAIDKELATSNLGYRLFSNEKEVNTSVLAKATRISALGSLLVGGLSGPGQELMWITDEDEIVANERVQSLTMGAIASMLNRFCPFGLGETALGIAGKFDDDRRAEDLCAIPDLVGGAIAESLNSICKATIPKSINMYSPVFSRLSTKSQIILAWLSTLSGPLKKLFCLLRPASDGKVLYSFADPSIYDDRFNITLWTPPDKGWARSSRYWR